MSTPYQPDDVSGATARSATSVEAPIEGAHDSYERGELSSIGSLVGDITADMSTLMRQEVALAKAELRESATSAGKGAGMLGGAGVAAHFMLLFLSIALWWGLGSLIDNHGWSAVIVAVLWGIVAAILAAMGKKELKKIDGAPRTVATAKQIPDAIKGNEDHR